MACVNRWLINGFYASNRGDRIMVEISASILGANHIHIARDVKLAEQEGIVQFHIDVTDGHYTSNLIFGDQLVADLRKETDAVLDVHLATYNLPVLTDNYIKAGADIITFQYESCEHPLRLIKQIKDTGIKVCICFTPSTEFEAVKFFIDEVDMVNLLAVEPGIGGQTFYSKVMGKIKRVAKYKEEHKLVTKIAVDGGINTRNVSQVIDAGADILIMGSSVFAGDIEENIKKLNRIINKDINLSKMEDVLCEHVL